MHKPVCCPLHRALHAAPLFLLCAMPLTGCGGGGNGNPINYQGNGRSGIRGTAYLLQADGTKTPYANSLLAATVVICPSFGEAACSPHDAAQVQTDAQGHFTLPLIPGSYGFHFISSPPANSYFVTQNNSATASALAYTDYDPAASVRPEFVSGGVSSP